MTQDELYKKLTEPLPYEDVGVKVQALSTDKKKGMVVAFMDARSAHDRLDRVFGPMNWYAVFKIVKETEKRIVAQCEISVQHEGLSVTKTDVGEGEDEKSSFSDSFKRAAVQFGIGRYLYALPKIWAPVNERGYLVNEDEAKRQILKDYLPKQPQKPTPQKPRPEEPETAATPAEHAPEGDNPLREKAYQDWTNKIPKAAKLRDPFMNASTRRLYAFLNTELGVTDKAEQKALVKQYLRTVLNRDVEVESTKEIVMDPELRRALNIAIFEDCGQVLFE